MTQLQELLDGADGRPYRDLVAYHLRRESTAQLRDAATAEILMLPSSLRELATEYIDAVNGELAYSRDFWREATCLTAFKSIMQIAVSVLPLDGVINSAEDGLRLENHDLSFQIFQISTLSFAYSASTQRRQRRFMGIRKGLLA